jgi:hypothetical protein
MIRFGCMLVLLMAPVAAYAECSSEDRIDLAQMGYSEAQIDAQCNSGQNAFAPPQSPEATYCKTQYGYCPLPSSPPPATAASAIPSTARSPAWPSSPYASSSRPREQPWTWVRTSESRAPGDRKYL